MMMRETDYRLGHDRGNPVAAFAMAQRRRGGATIELKRDPQSPLADGARRGALMTGDEECADRAGSPAPASPAPRT